VILPGIRKKNWLTFYKFLENSFNQSFELILVSPFEPEEELLNKNNVKFIKDFGSAARCQQIALTYCNGKYITWGADDGVFLKDKLQEAIEFLEKNKTSYKDIVTCKYFEGKGSGGVLHSSGKSEMSQDFYYKIKYACSWLNSPYVPEDYWILNVGIIETKYAKEVGGWDAQFEGTSVAHMDFAIRAQRNGSVFYMLEKPIFVCTHTLGPSGDHIPIHFGQIEHDEPLLRQIYSRPDCVNRIKINLNNWENAAPIWQRRFGNNISIKA
jgi:hypothetical protein